MGKPSRQLIQDDSSELRWSNRRRFEFIEFRLYWEGKLNRRDLIEFFGISVPQASMDLTRYQELAPDNLHYDKSAKCYVAAPGFTPQFMAPESNRYLAQLRSVSDGILEKSETWLSQLPGYGVLPLPRRAIDPKRLRTVLDAIRNNLALQVRYQSISRPEPMSRWITPHALGYDGFRWHVRAYCHMDDTFKDFLFARILGIRGSKEHLVDPGDDLEWNETVDVRIAPHPDLSPQQQRVIATDYGMKNGQLSVTVRRAFLYYLLKQLGLNTDAVSKTGREQHIVLLNADELGGEKESGD